MRRSSPLTAVFAMWHGHYWSVAGLLIADLMTGTQCLLGFDNIQNTALGFVGTILLVASSWAAVATESPGFYAEGRASAMEIDDNPATTTKEERIRDRTVQRCEIAGTAACGRRH